MQQVENNPQKTTQPLIESVTANILNSAVPPPVLTPQ